MRRSDLPLHLLQSCESGKCLSRLHSHILKTGLVRHSNYATKLNLGYAKLASSDDARKMFDELPHRTAYLWNAVLGSYCRERRYGQILYLFKQMVSNGERENEKPDYFTIPITLKACAGLRALDYGEMIHGYVKKNDEVDLNVFVGSALIDLYSKCGKIDSAFKVFKEFPRPDVVMRTSMISGYEQNGCPYDALQIFSQSVETEGFSLDQVTLISVVSACTQIMNLKHGSSVHGFMVRKGIDADLSLQNSLLNFYAKTGSIHVASKLFRKMPRKDVISWSSMISSYAHEGAANEALNLFHEMIMNGFEPNQVTIISALQACSVGCNLEDGKYIHALASKKKLELNVSVSTALINMYMKCLLPDEAINIFHRMPEKDIVAWVTLLSGYAENGMAYKSMQVFHDMRTSGIQTDAIAIVKVLAACSELGNFQQAACLHGYTVVAGFSSNMYVGASLIELYSKCGSLDSAIRFFNGICDKDVVIWSSMIAGYGMHGQGKEALGLFEQMMRNSLAEPNNVTLLSILSACSHSGLVEEGMELFHAMVHEYHLKPNTEHFCIVVDLLGRKGQLDRAIEIIKSMPTMAGSHVWGALLGACRIHDNIELGEFAANSLRNLDADHAGYYVLLSNIYAAYGKWDDMMKLRSLIKEKKKAFGRSVIEVKSEMHTFVADDRSHQDTRIIFELLRNVEMKIREESCVAEQEAQLHDI